jgi:hypothetical protein
MELLDRYLKSVASCLPTEQREDIIRELSENIRSQVEDKESELGRPLADSELEAILKQHGHPMIVAGRYRQDQRSVAFGRQFIGPVLFPFYIKVLSFNIGLTGVVLVVIFTALFASGQTVTFSGIFTTFLYQLLIQFGIVTLIFAAMDRHLAKNPDRWDPRKPGQMGYPQMAVAQDGPRVPRMESASQLIALSISIIWIRALQESPFWILGPAAAFLKLAPVLHQLYPPVAVLAILGMVQAGINLVRPDWIRVRSAGHVILSAGMFVIWFLLLRAGNWIIPVTSAGSPSDGYHRSIAIINQCFFYSLLLAVAISGFKLLRDLRRLMRGTSVNGATAPVL